MDEDKNNPGTDGTPNEGQEGGEQEEVVTVKKTEYDQLVQTNQDKESLVAEIKELRQKNQTTAAEKQELEDKINKLSGMEGVDQKDLTSENLDKLIESKLQESLSKQEQLNREKSREEALRKFKEQNKEFHDENDEAGLKWSALEKKLSLFNLNNAQSVEDFSNIFNQAKILLNREQPQPTNSGVGTVPDTPSNEATSAPVHDNSEKLTSVEQKIVDRTYNGDKQRYLDIKKKHPEHVAFLLDQAQRYST